MIIMQRLSDTVFYVVVQKSLLTSKKANFYINVHPDCIMHLTKIIPVGTRDFALMNGYKDQVKDMDIDYSKYTLLILEFTYNRL